jgi:tRNA G18 (ribose-2'-O)-methylase SpoU
MTGAVFVRIDDPEDPRVAAYRDIRERDLVGRQGLFVSEGEVVLRVLLGPRSRFKAVSVMVAESRLPPLEPLLATASVPVFVAAQTVMDRVASFPMHRGVLAIGEVRAAPPAAALLEALPSRALVVVALGIANHDNIGGIFRNAAAFGADAVLLDRASCDPLYRKAIRVSVGTSLMLPFARIGDEDVLALLAEAGLDPIALSPAGSRRLADIAVSDRVAVLVGAEGPGLPEAILKRLNAVSIPMAPGVDSLNVAVATGIVLHQLASRR